jgi:ribonuclease III
MKTIIKAVEKTLQYKFKKKAWLEEALTHPSFRHEVDSGTLADNQRLEFLGDSVLGLLTAERLFRLAPGLDEGMMTKYRSMVTSRSGLAEVAGRWQVGQYLRLGKGEASSGGATRDSNLVGAVYQDGGWKAAKKLFEIHFEPVLLTCLGTGVDAENPKGALQEYTQKHWQSSPAYCIVEEQGPSHARRYVAAVFWESRELARGTAASKRAAEVEAARNGLRILQEEMASRSSESVGTSS